MLFRIKRDGEGAFGGTTEVSLDGITWWNELGPLGDLMKVGSWADDPTVISAKTLAVFDSLNCKYESREVPVLDSNECQMAVAVAIQFDTDHEIVPDSEFEKLQAWSRSGAFGAFPKVKTVDVPSLDVFRAAGLGLVCTEKAQQAILEKQLTNFRFERVE